MKHTLLASALVGVASLSQAAGFTLSSSDIAAGGTIAQRFGLVIGPETVARPQVTMFELAGIMGKHLA
jgi:sorbitol-specific phosphotransferase system component IIBC